MNPHRTHKKNLIVSYKNLSEELKRLFKEAYPEGYSDYLQRFDKPNGDTIFVVPMETEDTVYMIKFDVKIDTTITDADDDKDFYDDEIEKADDDFAPLSEAIDKEENNNPHTERAIRHGDYEDALAPHKKKKGSLSGLGKELEEAFDNDDFGDDDYDDDDDLNDEDDDRDMDRDDFEPTDEELRDIDSDFYMENAEIPPEERALMGAAAAAKPKRGRPRKESSALPTTPKKKGRPRKNPAPED